MNQIWSKTLQKLEQVLTQQSYKTWIKPIRFIDSDDATIILEAPNELIAGVEQTLDTLSARHELAVFTKGHADEQRMKVERSGLERYFRHTEIVKEKNASAYASLVANKGFAISETWMIGNSPKSDINPALESGLGAVLVPHAHTWVLEHQDLRIPPAARFLEVAAFDQLVRVF